MSTRIIVGDCRDMLPTLASESVHCVVTSPPYYGLRDYGIAGQIGLEPDFQSYIASIVEVFREMRRVLRKDGTLWLNLGDSYAGSWGNQGRKEERGTQRPINGGMLTPVLDGRYPNHDSNTGSLVRMPGLKPKDLVGIPWRVAFALQEDGWWLRQSGRSRIRCRKASRIDRRRRMNICFCSRNLSDIFTMPKQSKNR
jgi:hypothetical protein